MTSTRISLLILLFIVYSSRSLGAVLLLSNGDTLSGDLVKLEASHLVWKSSIFGAVDVPREHVTSLNGKPLPIEPPEPASPIDFSGKIDVDIERDLGSSDSEEFDSSLRLSLSHGHYAHFFKVEYESEKKRERAREEEYEANYQAERHFNETKTGFYLYGRGEWNEDRFRVPERWAALGGGFGYAWRPSAHTRFKVQLGADRWSITEPTGRRDASGGRWLLALKHDIPQLAGITLFHDFQALWSLDGTRNRIVETTTGLRLPIIQRAFLELSADYDRYEIRDDQNTQFTGNETEWNMKLGYRW